MFEFQFLDKRVQRTKLDLYNALFTLLEDFKYEQISVKHIVTLANYSRGVFYTHYKDKDDLLEEIIHYLFAEARKAQRMSYKGRDTIKIHELVNEPLYTLEHFKKYGYYYQILLKENIKGPFNIQLMQNIIETYLTDFKMDFSSDNNPAMQNMLSRYYAYGLLGLIVEWIMDDFPTDTKTFSSE